jgi:hypothetical protein
MPQKEWSGIANISFPLDLQHFQDMGDVIEEEIGGSGSSYDLTLQSVVSVGTGLDYVQLLPIRMTKLYIKIGDGLTSVSSGGQGKFDYQVKLRENTLFGPVTLTPPAAPPKAPEIILGPADTIFTKFIDNMKVNYGYRLTSDRPLKQTQEEVIIEAILENPGRWSKTYTLVPPTQQNGDVSLTFPLNLQQFTDIFNTIRQETGVSASSQNLILQATVHTVAQTDQGTIDKTYVQSVKTDLGQGILTWTGDMKKSEPGSIEVTRVIVEPSRLWGRPVLEVRILSVSITAIMFVLLVFILAYLRRRPETALLVEKKAREIGQKYRAVIVELNERPETSGHETVLTVDSLEELIKVSQGLLKPVNHWADADEHVYWVYDESRRYEYRLTHEIRSSKDEMLTT